LDEPIEHELNTSGRACPELLFRGQHIKCAIIGLPNAGKTAIFNLLTGCNEVESETMYSTIEPCMGICTIPDPRFDWLVSRHNPKVATPVRMTMMDGPALVRGSHHKVVGSIAGGIDFLHKFVRPLSDLLMLVVRSFDDGDLTHFEESVDPVRDCMTLLAGMFWLFFGT
jgi:ribosome-binding ATPase YchF (GTP1/OBG family)